MLPKPKPGCYYYTGQNPVMFMKVIRITYGLWGRVYFIDSFNPKNKNQWSYLTDWKKDLRSGEIQPAPVHSAMRALEEINE